MKKALLLLSMLFLAMSSFAQAATHSVVLTWTPSVTACVSTVNVHRVTTSGAEVIGTNFAVIPVGTTMYTDTTVASGTTYYYKVSAYCSSNNTESGFSNEFVAVIPNDPPAAPTGLTGVVK